MTKYQSIRLRLIIGFAGLFIGRLIHNFGGDFAYLGLPLMLIVMPIFVWGCWDLAKGKGYSGAVGLLGLLSLVGLIILLALPDKMSSFPADADDSPED